MTPTKKIGEIMRAVALRDRERKRAWKQRAELTVTLQRRSSDAMVTVCGGSDDGVTTALRERLGSYPVGEWRVLTISTPSSILTDLRRAHAFRQPPNTNERALLGRIRKTGYLT